MTAASLLLNYLTQKSQQNYYTAESIRISTLYNSYHKKLAEQQKYQSAYENAYDSALNNTSEKKCGCICVAKDNTDESIAEQYAEAKVSEYDPELLAELEFLDEQYDIEKTTIEAQLEELEAQLEKDKEALSKSAQETHTLN